MWFPFTLLDQNLIFSPAGALLKISCLLQFLVWLIGAPQHRPLVTLHCPRYFCWYSSLRRCCVLQKSELIWYSSRSLLHNWFCIAADYCCTETPNRQFWGFCHIKIDRRCSGFSTDSDECGIKNLSLWIFTAKLLLLRCLHRAARIKINE